ncbi:hypothetical protein ZHAS_00002144 [Anopheles sinensis]|uniref:Uncharacterized protein n=1 Tax=Anopheles sinensis TaxID=74873 RepID=A0A084VBV1_ANOSI|nr:hypothetical protein ZHAS_00002144 [Anopheles sinensis]
MDPPDGPENETSCEEQQHIACSIERHGQHCPLRVACEHELTIRLNNRWRPEAQIVMVREIQLGPLSCAVFRVYQSPRRKRNHQFSEPRSLSSCPWADERHSVFLSHCPGTEAHFI